MMRKHPYIHLPTISRLKLKFSNFSGGINTLIDENLLPINYAKMSYNANFQNRALTTGIGFQPLSLPLSSTSGNRRLDYTNINGNILGVWVFPRHTADGNRDDIIFVYADDEQIYYQALNSDFEAFASYVGFVYSGKPNVLFHRQQDADVAVLSSASDHLAIWNGIGTPVKVANTLSLTSLCVHYERLFATTNDNRNLIRFSANFDLTEWDESPEEGGFIELVDERGECNKVISFNDYVYIIRERGISRLSAYGEQQNFSVTHLFLSSDKIYENTCVLCGDRLIMLCSDGLYAFNGATASKYPIKINDMFVRDKMDSAYACYYNGKYYLACNLNFSDSRRVGVENDAYTNNALFEFDIKTGDYTITRGVDILHLCPLTTHAEHKLIAVFADADHKKVLGEMTADGCFFGVPLQKNWTSPLSDFGYPEKEKIVREVHLLSRYPISITVSSECESRTFQIRGGNGISKVYPNVKGQRISLSFDSSEPELLISNPNVVVDLI